ncbi:retrovirus-related pol polyprotein from transposon TNT 1-94, partial [Tanacetum coccineum]
MTEAVKIAYYTRNKSIIVKRHDKTPYEIFRERIPDINYFHVFRCHVFIHNHKDHLGKFDAKANDRCFLGYSFVSKAFRVFNTRIQQIEETYHVIFDESMEVIKFTHTSEDDIDIDDSSRYPPNEFVHEDDLTRKYQIDADILYYVIPHGRSLSELTQDNQVPEVIALNEPNIPHIEDTEGNNTEVSGSITESLVPDVTQSHISNQASISSHPIPQDRWSRYQHIELVNIIGDPGKGMLTRSMVAKLIATSTSECLFADFLSEIEPKKLSEALKHLGWVNAMQEELNQSIETKYGLLLLSLMEKQPQAPDGYQSNPKESHLTAVKRILMYLKGTPTLGLYYPKCSSFDLKGYLDSDYAGCNMDNKSTSAEAEYVIAARCCASILWMKSQLSDYDIHYKK